MDIIQAAIYSILSLIIMLVVRSKHYLLLAAIFFAGCAMGQTDTGYYTSFDGAKIYYEVKGKGMPVVLVHSFTNTGTEWKTKPIYDTLVSNGYKVITVDLRGNGRSDTSADSLFYASDAEAKDITGLLKHLRIKKFYAVGYSRGSIIVSRLLVLNKKCRKAVMGGMGADFTNPQWPRRLEMAAALENDSIKGYDDFRKYISRKGLNPKVLAAQQKAQPYTTPNELVAMKSSVLVICGNKDFVNGSATALQKIIPRSVYISIEGEHNTAHHSTAFAQVIVRFLNVQ
jgi:pimeloyl-ACP methyl ester carboxylesterase